MEELGTIHSVEALGEFMREKARAVGKDFTEPDDDWMPLVVAVGKDNTVLIGMEMPEDSNERHILFSHILPGYVRNQLHGEPLVVAFMAAAWGLDDPAALAELGPDERVSDSPNRIETVTLFVIGRKKEEVWAAPVYRDWEQPPGLGEWKCYEQTSERHQLGGNIPEGLRRVFE